MEGCLEKASPGRMKRALDQWGRNLEVAPVRGAGGRVSSSLGIYVCYTWVKFPARLLVGTQEDNSPQPVGGSLGYTITQRHVGCWVEVAGVSDRGQQRAVPMS